jgi:predicted TIM-barrel fold metal-dependent hydrolase
MLEKYPFWRGVGEILCRHDDLTNLTKEETARVNHPALFDIYELCAARKLPVLIHQNSTSVSIHDEYEHLHELEEVLKEFPKTQFVWAHVGMSRRVFHKNYHEMIVSLFDGHFEHVGRTMARYNKLLERLTPRAQNMIAKDNAERLWFGEPDQP